MRNFSKSSVFAGIGMAAAVVAVGACLTTAVPAVAASDAAGQTLAQATTVSYDAACPGFVDADGDGLCDNCEARATRGHHGCTAYVDENKDGVCDTCTNAGSWRTVCGGYVDANSDGVCDACGARHGYRADGCGGRHHGSTLGHHGGGWGHGHC